MDLIKDWLHMDATAAFVQAVVVFAIAGGYVAHKIAVRNRLALDYRQEILRLDDKYRNARLEPEHQEKMLEIRDKYSAQAKQIEARVVRE